MEIVQDEAEATAPFEYSPQFLVQALSIQQESILKP